MSFDSPLPPYNASDPHATFLNSSCLDLLLIEMVPMAYRLAYDRAVSRPGPRPRAGAGAGAGAGREEEKEGERAEDEDVDADEEEERRVLLKLSTDEEEQREDAFRRLETLGYRVGLGLAERWVFTFYFLFFCAVWISLGMKGWGGPGEWGGVGLVLLLSLPFI